MHQDDRLERGFQIEAQLVWLRLQARGESPVAGFGHNDPILRTVAGGTHLQATSDGPASDEARALGGLIPVDELDAQSLRLGVDHQGVMGGETVECVAP